MEFYRDKRKSMNLILICTGILLVLLAIFLYSIGLFDDHISTKLAAATGIFSIILIIIIITKLFSLRDQSPLVVLNDEGIISKVTAVSKAAGLILWKDITDISLEKVGADTLVILIINNPEQYLPLIKKKLSGFVTNGLTNPDGTLPISLTASELNIDAAELYSKINSFWK
ncbi:MAG: hypothetical protein EOO19_13800 [Chryseobacterium sp.]|nr:MAG: hypothetical protein EOO19_13800 [Chryseobacterium sp.]